MGAPASRKSGAILILVMLVVLILAAVMVQIWISTDVDLQTALYRQSEFPLRQAAYGTFMQCCSALVQDLQGEGEGSTGEGDPEGGGDDGSGGDPGLGGMGGGDLGAEGGAANDSMVDNWARPGGISMAFSSEVEVKVLIRDEDGKFNILSILSEDEEFADESFERLIRVIDLFREGTRGDISRGSAHEIADSMKAWMKGGRDTHSFPLPVVKTGKSDKDKEELDKDPIDFPLTIEELVLCDEITENLFFGYIEDGERIPGLLEYITIYSNLVMDSPKVDEEEGEEEDPYANEGGDELGELPPGEEGDDGGGDPGEESEPVETNNGLININTAPLSVLKALLEPEDIPYSILDHLGEFRSKAIEAYEETLNDYGQSDNTFGGGLGNDGGTGEGDEGDDGDTSGFDDEEEEEDFIFKDPGEIFDRMEEYFQTTYDIEEDAKTEFSSLITVTSKVFTIYIMVQDPAGTNSRLYRAVVWRRDGTGSEGENSGSDSFDSGGGGQIITLVPLEQYRHPMPYRPGEEERLDENLDEYRERNYW